MIVCKNRDQQQGLLRCKSLLGKEVKAQIWEDKGKSKGVISGVPIEISEEKIRANGVYQSQEMELRVQLFVCIVSSG